MKKEYECLSDNSIKIARQIGDYLGKITAFLIKWIVIAYIFKIVF